MPTKRLTQKAVEVISAPADGRLELWDDLTPGLVLRVTSNGARTFACMTRLRGERIRVTIGKVGVVKLADARIRARDIITAATKGDDPRPKKGEPDATTVAAQVEDFLTRYADANTRKSTATEYARYLRSHVVPAWGRRDVADIKKRDIVILIDKIAAEAPYAANRCLAAVSKFFSWLAARDVIEASPASGISKPTVEKARDRVLEDIEIAQIWRATGTVAEAPRDLIRVLMLTAQRREEVATMRWSDVNLADGTWTIPGEVAKNGVANVVPLSPAVLSILKSAVVHDHCDFVFTTNGRTPFSGFSKLKTALDAAILSERRKVDPEAAAPAAWRFHDLRRSAATGMAKLGIDRLHISKVLNHAEKGVTGQVYERHRYEAEKRRGLDAWAAHVERVVNGAASNVVPIRA